MPEVEIPDPSVILMVGAAGSGKSTLAARLFPPGSVLSSDELRASIAGDAADQSTTRPAFAALHRALDRRLAAGLLTVVDATNVTAGARRSIRRIAGRHHVPVVAIVLDLPAEVVRERNAGRRERIVPDAIVTRHLARLRAALVGGELAAEGYTPLVHVRDGAEIDALSVRLLPRRRRPGRAQLRRSTELDSGLCRRAPAPTRGY